MYLCVCVCVSVGGRRIAEYGIRGKVSPIESPLPKGPLDSPYDFGEVANGKEVRPYKAGRTSHYELLAYHSSSHIDAHLEILHSVPSRCLLR